MGAIMSIVNDEPFLDREDGRKLYEESDKLLRLAEGLQEKCEQYERNWWLQVAVHSSMFLLCLASTFYFTIHAVLSRQEDAVLNGWMWASAAALALLYIIVGTIYLGYARARIDRQLAREKRALHSIVDLLRDLEKGIAEQGNLSTLERAAFRIRLSRFDIGPGK